MREVVEPMPASSSAARPRGADRGRGVQVGPVRDEVGVVASAPAWRNTHRSSGTPSVARPLDRAHDQRGGHVDVVVRVHELRVREADHAVRRCRRADLLGASCASLHPRVRDCCAATVAEPGPQLGRAHLMRRRTPRPRSARSAVSNIGYTCTGITMPRVELGRDGSSASRRRSARVGAMSSGCLSHVEDHVGAAGAHPGAPRLATHEDGAVEGAVVDLARRWGSRASGACCRPRSCTPSRRGWIPRPRRHEGGGIAVAPRQQLHDAQRLGVGEDTRRTRRRPRRRAPLRP